MTREQAVAAWNTRPQPRELTAAEVTEPGWSTLIPAELPSTTIEIIGTLTPEQAAQSLDEFMTGGEMMDPNETPLQFMPWIDLKLGTVPKDRPILLFLRGYHPLGIRWIQGYWSESITGCVAMSGQDLTPYLPSHWCDPGEPKQWEEK